MDYQRPQLLIISISLLYWFRNTADCWKFDGGGPGSLGPGYRVPRSASNLLAARGPPPVIPNAGGGGGSGSFANLFNSQPQDILYSCPLNSMCQCAGLPNETTTLIEINCNEVELYKFPGEKNIYTTGKPGKFP